MIQGRASAVWTAGLALVAGALLAAAAYGAQAGSDDPFYKGLEDRGLRSLMEFYLRQQGGDAGSGGGGGTESPGDAKLMLANLEVNKAAQAEMIGERNAAYARAYDLFLEAVADMQAGLEKVPEAKWQEQADLRLKIITTRMAFANIVFNQWLRGDLDLLEVADRRSGDCQGALSRLEKAKTQFLTALEETNQWLSEIDRLPEDEQDRLINAGYKAKLNGIRREAEYFGAWVRYSYAWLLPKDYKSPDGGRSRKDLLGDVITIFEGYTTLGDNVTAKWYAYLVIGMAHRERGEFNDAQTALQQAGGPNAPQELKIRVIFERARTYIYEGKFKDARNIIDEGRQLFGGAVIDRDTYGFSLPLLAAESYILQAKAEHNDDLRQKGVALFKEVSDRGDTWAMVVGGLMNDLLGVQADPGNMEPIQLWLLAEQTREDAQQKGDKEKFAQAADLYKVYLAKVKPDEPNFPAALYYMGACFVTLDRGDEAVASFQRVADEFPNYAYAKNAAALVVQITSAVFEKAQTEENRQKYEDALKWYVAKWIDGNPDQRYFYALILYRGKKYTEAAEQFNKVAEASPYYVDARYWIALCRLESFRDKVLPTRDPGQIIPEARDVAKGLRDFAAYATAVQGLPDEKQKTVRDWAMVSLITAADVYLYPEVGLAEDALTVLAQLEKDFTLPNDMRGKILKLRIDALQKLNRLKEAQDVLAQYLAVAPSEEVGPVLRGLFRAVMEEVKRLVGTDVAAARTKVDGAEKIGSQLCEWLEAHGGKDKDARIEDTQYDMAGLYLEIGDFDRATGIYEKIVGTVFPPPEPLKVEGILGLARCYEARAFAAPDKKQAELFFDKALQRWQLLRDVEEANHEADRDMQQLWLYRYHVYVCLVELGKAKEASEGLKSLEIVSKPVPLGGNDPVLQTKFRELKAKAAAGAK